MATSTSYTEEECFNIYWKIKNFSYCCGEITSPEFNFSVNQYWLFLNPGSIKVECTLEGIAALPPNNLRRQITFLTCDGSQEESISGGRGLALGVPRDVIFGNRRSSFLPEDTLTVRIRFPTDSERGKLLICSQIGVKYKYFLWTLKNFCENESTRKKSVEKSRLYGDIELSLQPMGGFNTDEHFYVEVSRTGGEMCYYTLKMSVLDVDGKALNAVTDAFVFEKKYGHQNRGFLAFFKKKKLRVCENLVLPEDTLSLKCNFAVSLGTLEDQTVLSYCEDVTPLLKDSKDLLVTFKGKSNTAFVTELQTDLNSILDDGTLFDASLQIATEVIQVHKIILSARSPVFKAMFTKDMKETINNTVLIEDLDVETVRRLVLYMYTDIISDCQWANIKKLYLAANKYEVVSLKKKCISFLKTNLSISNVCEVLVLADLHQDGDLRTATFDFISEHVSVIFTSEVWKKLEKDHSLLVLQVMREIWCNEHII